MRFNEIFANRYRNCIKALKVALDDCRIFVQSMPRQNAIVLIAKKKWTEYGIIIFNMQFFLLT